MKFHINIISTEVVTPSSPTPPHLKNYKLSFLDQIMPHVLSSAILFYPANGNIIKSNSEVSNHLKKSLSKTLTLFYPLAGRLVGNSYVNCNDEGVTYVEAQANCNLFDVINNPISEELDMFFPCRPKHGSGLCLVVQGTFFCCGGLAIALGISHKLADGLSFAMFFNTWAAFSRGDDHIRSPIFESAHIFPPKDLISKFAVTEAKETLISKMFTFSSQKINTLKDKYTKNTKDIEESIRPTRVETLSAFITSRYMVATDDKDGNTRKDYALKIIIDIRTGVVPPLSEYHFGNIIKSQEITLPPLGKKDEDGEYSIVKKSRDAIRNVKGDVFSAIKKRMEDAKNSEAVVCYFSNLCNFPRHKFDFGWGIPVWVGLGSIPLKNVVYFTNSLSGGGIDAFVNMTEEDMAKFEADEVLLKYVSCRGDTKFQSKM